MARLLGKRPLTNAEKQARYRAKHVWIKREDLWAFGPGSTGILLDLPVRTDTKGGSRGLKGGDSGPIHLIRCPECGWPVMKCRCRAGRDY